MAASTSIDDPVEQLLLNRQQLLSSADAIAAALETNAMIVDVRGEGELEVAAKGAVNIVFDKETGTMDVAGLPDDKSAPIMVHCQSGLRASKAKTFLEAKGYTNVLNGGGPKTPELWSLYGK